MNKIYKKLLINCKKSQRAKKKSKKIANNFKNLNHKIIHKILNIVNINSILIKIWTIKKYCKKQLNNLLN